MYQVGRDAVQQTALLSDLRDTAPFSHLIRQVLYRVETALESVRNRIYALLVASLVLLAASLLFFIGVAFLSDEYETLQDAANGFVIWS
jgi:dolichol kinase